MIEYTAGSPDDVQMPRRHGVETPGADRHDHCDLRPLKYRHERAAVAARDPFLASCTLRLTFTALDHDPTAGREQGANPGHDAPDLRRCDSIWRIGEDQIE